MNERRYDAVRMDLMVFLGRVFCRLQIDQVTFILKAEFAQRYAATLRAIRHTAVPQV